MLIGHSRDMSGVCMIGYAPIQGNQRCAGHVVVTIKVGAAAPFEVM
jgi:hypothetical protein